MGPAAPAHLLVATSGCRASPGTFIRPGPSCLRQRRRCRMATEGRWAAASPLFWHLANTPTADGRARWDHPGRTPASPRAAQTSGWLMCWCREGTWPPIKAASCPASGYPTGHRTGCGAASFRLVVARSAPAHAGQAPPVPEEAAIRRSTTPPTRRDRLDAAGARADEDCCFSW